jgi:hypothetical protein
MASPTVYPVATGQLGIQLLSNWHSVNRPLQLTDKSNAVNACLVCMESLFHCNTKPSTHTSMYVLQSCGKVCIIQIVIISAYKSPNIKDTSTNMIHDYHRTPYKLNTVVTSTKQKLHPRFINIIPMP